MNFSLIFQFFSFYSIYFSIFIENSKHVYNVSNSWLTTTNSPQSLPSHLSPDIMSAFYNVAFSVLHHCVQLVLPYMFVDVGSSTGVWASASGHIPKENNFPSLSSYQLPIAPQLWVGLRSLLSHCEFSLTDMSININMNIPKISSCNFLVITELFFIQIILASSHCEVQHFT